MTDDWSWSLPENVMTNSFEKSMLEASSKRLDNGVLCQYNLA